MLTIALSKGRILQQTLPLLEKSGIEINNINSRKLVLNTNLNEIKVIIIRATDVPIFVQHGVADIGVTGKDMLIEHGANGVFELLDLKIAKCKLMIASEPEKKLQKNTLKIATKYIEATKNHFENKSQQVEIIKLNGAIELAPKIGLSDCIVDLVATGNTLKANGLVAVENIMDISSRLIVNTAAFKTKNAEIKKLVETINKII
jgi:ATP phosphoribosyltransferase